MDSLDQRAPKCTEIPRFDDASRYLLDDSDLTGAILGRIAHKTHIVDMTGESYRVIGTKERVHKEIT